MARRAADETPQGTWDSTLARADRVTVGWVVLERWALAGDVAVDVNGAIADEEVVAQLVEGFGAYSEKWATPEAVQELFRGLPDQQVTDQMFNSARGFAFERAFSAAVDNDMVTMPPDAVAFEAAPPGQAAVDGWWIDGAGERLDAVQLKAGAGVDHIRRHLQRHPDVGVWTPADTADLAERAGLDVSRVDLEMSEFFPTSLNRGREAVAPGADDLAEEILPELTALLMAAEAVVRLSRGEDPADVGRRLGRRAGSVLAIKSLTWGLGELVGQSVAGPMVVVLLVSRASLKTGSAVIASRTGPTITHLNARRETLASLRAARSGQRH